MKQIPLRSTGLSIVAALALCWWYFRETKPRSEVQVAERSAAPPAERTDRKAVSDPLPVPPLPAFGTPEFKKALLARGQKWLDSRGRDAVGLVAMWYLAGEQSVLDEAAEKFPRDPRVCLAVIHLHREDTVRAMPWIERLISAEPGDPDGLYQKAWAHMNERWDLVRGQRVHDPAGNRPEAIAALQMAAVMKGNRKDHDGNCIQSVHGAALACGVSPGDAVRLALYEPLIYNATGRAVISAADALSMEWVAAKAAGDEERLMEITGLTLVTVEKLSRPRALSVSDEFSLNTREIAILESIPDDTEIGEGGHLVGDLRHKLKKRHGVLLECLDTAKKATELLKTASDDRMTAYFNRFMSSSDERANEELLHAGGQR
jgi:hypothetical protein